jgi:hypothetical protein
MHTNTVNAVVQVETRVFPLDVKPTAYLFELFNKDGFRMSFVENQTPEVSFPLVPQGGPYTIKCTRNGVTASTTFDVPITVNEIDVPIKVTVSFA